MGMYDVMMQILGTSISRLMILMPERAYQAHTKAPPLFPNVTCQGGRVSPVQVHNLLFKISI